MISVYTKLAELKFFQLCDKTQKFLLQKYNIYFQLIRLFKINVYHIQKIYKKKQIQMQDVNLPSEIITGFVDTEAIKNKRI